MRSPAAAAACGRAGAFALADVIAFAVANGGREPLKICQVGEGKRRREGERKVSIDAFRVYIGLDPQNCLFLRVAPYYDDHKGQRAVYLPGNDPEAVRWRQ